MPLTFILSPTKTMEIPVSFTDTDRDNALTASQPDFEPEADRLMGLMSGLDEAALSALFKTGDALTRRTRDQVRQFGRAPSGPAMFAFRGEAFKTLAPEQFGREELHRAQCSMRILSGLYGVLRPLDRIKPYRLDTGTPLKIKGQTLKAFWRSRLLPYFEDLLEPDLPLVNLASAEYSSVLAAGALKSRLLTIQFREKHPDKLKNVAVRAKQARGAFAAEMIRQGPDHPDALKSFCIDGYTYADQLSSPREWFFVRPAG